MRPCSTCIRVAQRVSENNGGTSFKLLVRGSSPRRPTKGLVGVGVRHLCCANHGNAPSLTRELTTCNRGRDSARTVDPSHCLEVDLPGGPGLRRTRSRLRELPDRWSGSLPPCFELPRCHPRREGHQRQSRVGKPKRPKALRLEVDPCLEIPSGLRGPPTATYELRPGRGSSDAPTEHSGTRPDL
jgi:hypothetical protein